ncbi:MAG TPA: zinc ribbon domain-containing protein [Methanocorpusculum sp.]|nr:zinc ribbon domain-containing protein [Methanocorpusculum sp.]
MGFFNDLKTSAKEGVDDIKKSVKTEELKSQIRDLERKENEAYAEIGREAVALDGPDKFGEKGENLMKLQSEIETKKNELAVLEKKPEPEAEEAKTEGEAAAEEEPSKKFCTQCGAEVTAEMKFCGKCGAKLD